MSTYYIQAGGVQQGPYAESQLRTMWNSGSVPIDTIYWTEGMAEWAPIVQLMQSPEPQAIQPATQVNPPVEVVDGVFKWFCQYCGTKVSVDTDFLEQIWQEYHGKISCPSCSQEIPAPQVGANPMPSAPEAAHPGEVQATIQPIEPPTDVQASGTCPNCQGPVELEQAVCVGCGHNLKINASAIPETKYTISQEDRVYIKKQGKGIKIITYIDLFLLISNLIVVVFFLVDDSDWSMDPIQICIPFALPRVWGIILVLRLLDKLREIGIKELGALDIYNKIMSFADDRWWVPEQISMIIKLPFILMFLCPIIGTGLLFFVFRKVNSTLMSGAIKE